MKNSIGRLVDILQFHKDEWTRRHAVIGFDGFIDSIVRPVKEKDDADQLSYFKSMAELGRYIESKQGLSCCIELDEQVVKVGGNAPIMAMGLGKLGVRVHCVGAMGVPEIHPLFAAIQSDNCMLHSYADPGYTTALELGSSKLMLAKMNALNTINWGYVRQCIGTEKLIRLFRDSHVIGMVNWSEIFHANAIWEGILDEIMPLAGSDRSKLLYIDLSDCSSRSREHIQHALELMKQYTRYCRVALGMNENEARLIHGVLYNNDAVAADPAISDLTDIGARMYADLGVDTLLIHRANCSMGWNRTGACRIDNYYTEDTLVSTGVGDNFNVGYCAADLLGLDMESCLITAGAVAGFYVRRGCSPSSDEVIAFLREWQETAAM